MKRSARRTLGIAIAVAVLVAAALVWDGAVERWIGHELQRWVATRLEPSFAFDDLNYRFPRTLTLRGVRLTSPDPESHGKAIEILAMDSLTLALSRIPRPNEPFRMQQLELGGPRLRLVRIREGEGPDRLLGFSDLLKEKHEPRRHAAPPPAKLSDRFQVPSVSLQGGRIQYDPRDGGGDSMLIDGINAKLLLRPSDVGSYGIAFSLDHSPALALELRGHLHLDDERLEVSALSSTLQLSRAHDHYLLPSLQKLLAEQKVTGRLTLAATGMLDLDDVDASHLKAQVELSDVGFAAADYGLVLDRVSSRISADGKSVTIEKLAIAAVGGHAGITGTLELDDSLTGAFSFEGAALQIGDLLRGADDRHGVSSFSGLLDFRGTLDGPLAEIDRRAGGRGRLSVRRARLARLPVLSRIDDALDAAAEALMKRESHGHDELSLHFSLEGDRVKIENLRMNSRWYGLRGHGHVYFDSRLDLKVDGGPVPRVENELGALGDVMGEITETLLRAHVTGTLAKPKVDIEVFRHRLRL